MILQRYGISDASKLLLIEPHVLRNWEYELKLDIPRTENGHRYYTDELLKKLKIIKKLKDNGFTLKHIKLLLPKLNKINLLSSNELQILKDKLNCSISNSENICENINDKDISSILTDMDENTSSAITSLSKDILLTNTRQLDKLEAFRHIVKETFSSVLRENYKIFAKELSTYVSNNVAKEVNYHLMQQENRNEEYYKRLDNLLTSMSNRSKKKSKNTKSKKHQFKIFPTH